MVLVEIDPVLIDPAVTDPVDRFGIDKEPSKVKLEI
jgi:ribosomal protein L31E